MPENSRNTRLDVILHIIEDVVGAKEEGSAKARSRIKKTRVGYALLKVPSFEAPATTIADRFASRGIMSPRVMAERLLRGVDLDVEARSVGLEPTQVAAIYQRALDSLSPEVRAALEDAAKRPRPTGVWSEKRMRAEEKRFGRKWQRPPTITREDLDKLISQHPIKLPFGPTRAVDLRPTLGPARTQGGRGTCTAFGSTAVLESLLYMRDPRQGPRDMSEEFIYWYAKGGMLNAGDGYDGRTILQHFTEVGSCPEPFFPYGPTYLSFNSGQLPAPDHALDRAAWYKLDRHFELPVTDDLTCVKAIKRVLESGRCVSIGSMPHDAEWDTGSGVISFPANLDRPRESNHCVTIIGYIDRDDLPETHEGGYFIIRNSWGMNQQNANVLGEEYGGHLLMPYGWFRRYVPDAATVAEERNFVNGQTTWLAEFFDNMDLRGKPARVERLSEISHDWGSGGPLANHPDRWSARFTQFRRLNEGWYTFRLTGDDGVRLWLDDLLLINAWKDQPATTHERLVHLTGGEHRLRVEYYENTGSARLGLSSTPVSWKYELFNGLLQGPVSTFNDSRTSFEWRHAPPVTQIIGNGQFRLRASASVPFSIGKYRFHATHTGGCKITVGGQVVLDDPTGALGDGQVVDISEGNHDVVVEFHHDGTVNVPEGTYYRAALTFGWSDEQWHATIHEDRARRTMTYDPSLADVDYTAYRTFNLTGDPVARVSYPASGRFPAVGEVEWEANDGASISVDFRTTAALGKVVPGTPVLPDDYVGVHLRRRIWTKEPGWYWFTSGCDDGFRLIVDGRQVIEGHKEEGADVGSSLVWLGAGLHQITLEYANKVWGGRIGCSMSRASWNVTYYRNRDLTQVIATGTVNSASQAVEKPPAAVGTTNFALRAATTMDLPVGRYLVHVRGDDGIRLRVDGIVRLDAWVDQATTGHSVLVDHRGGAMRLEVDYFQSAYDRSLAVEVTPCGWVASYYRGTTLQSPPPGSALDRNVPVAYRFESELGVDAGSGPMMPRVGRDDSSVRWFGAVDLPAGRWTVRATSDDGIRVYLDGMPVIDEWTDGAHNVSRTLDLVCRQYQVVVEHYERTGDQRCQVRFEREP